MSPIQLFDTNNCLICNDFLGPLRNSIKIRSEISGKLLSDLIQSLLNTRISHLNNLQASICQSCFIEIEKFEHLKIRAKEIQRNLVSLFQRSSSDKSSDTPNIEIYCHKCQKSFASLAQLTNHKHCQLKRKSALDDKIDLNFRDYADANGIEYSCEAFQKAFNCAESENLVKKVKKPLAEKVAAPISNLQISSEFSDLIAQEGGFTYNLEIFQKTFGFFNSAEQQFKEQVKSTKKLKTKVDVVQCSKCDEVFSSKYEFCQHMKSHNKTEIYCDDCNRDFTTKHCLDLHLATNHDNQKSGPFVCPVCLKNFNEKNGLRSHLYTHGIERNFLCNTCGADFMYKKSFDMHIMMHEDVRPFACNVCSKRFRNKGKLNIHLRVHTGEKKYECPHCPDKKFRQKWGLDLHTKKVHANERSNQEHCQICGSSFECKSKLRQHLVNAHHVANAQQFND